LRRSSSTRNSWRATGVEIRKLLVCAGTTSVTRCALADTYPREEVLGGIRLETRSVSSQRWTCRHEMNRS
jgi:hypothetical protein